jgi:SAM-dependent methyltransferase
MEPSIYRYPAIFRRVHMEQPGEIEQETTFLRRVWRRHLKGRRVRRVLDLASGDSPHGRILARDGVEVAAVDRSPTMIAAGRKDSRGLSNIRFYRREIARFSLPERPFDAAFFMSETFPILTANDTILSHLRSVGRLLRRGGLYCIDVDRMDRPRMLRARRPWQRRTVRVENATVAVRTFNRPIPWHSGLHSIFELECEIHFDHGATVTTRDVIPIRYTLPYTLELAARASGMFKMAAVYTDLSFVTRLDRCDRRWLGVLERV